MNEQQKQKWLTVMTNEFMSSEESGSDDDIVTHALPWRSEYVTRMFLRIDAYNKERKSRQAIRQTKQRRPGSDSTRPCPIPEYPDWAVASCQ